ncbi:unnamed protein product [Durusdinium trenchii]|uniref:Uncharacterized protein n=1 Tax=Durusdinium trenchii TaxID=1381693 RepID=A0ABP0JXM6_9DINO
MGITPPLARIISRRSGIQRSMLLMAAHTGTMWLNATLCAIYMSEHCMRGWTTFWTMCDPTSDLYHRFEVRLGHHRFLDPIQDLCTENHRWWKEDASRTRKGNGELCSLASSRFPDKSYSQFWFLERLLLPAAGMAASTNLLLVQLGRRHFHAVVPSLDGETASMSRKYLQASVGILLIF